MTRHDFERLRWHPVAWAVAGIFLAVTLGNGRFGWLSAGGFNGGAGLIGVLVAVGVAVVGAWLPTQWRHGTLPTRLIIVMLLPMVIAYTQIAGWRVMGVSMADTAVQRETDATDRQVAVDALRLKRDERARLGVQRPEASVLAAERLECAKRSPRYPDGVGPACTDLRDELGRVQRAAQLDKEIATAAAALSGKRQVASGTPDLDQVAAILSVVSPGTTAAQVGFWLPVFVVLLMDLTAFFGPVLLGVHGGEARRAGGAGPSGATDGWPDDDVWGDPGPVRLPPPSGRQRIEGLGGEAVGGSSSSSSPISITVGYPALAPPSRGEAERQEGRASAGEAGSATAPRTIVPRRRDLPALDAGGPVDRSSVLATVSDAERPAADVLLGFATACIVRTPGGLVDLVHLYRRYQRWVGERAMAEPAFRRLLADLCGIEIVDIGGQAHAQGIALRGASALQQVA